MTLHTCIGDVSNSLMVGLLGYPFCGSALFKRIWLAIFVNHVLNNIRIVQSTSARSWGKCFLNLYSPPLTCRESLLARRLWAPLQSSVAIRMAAQADGLTTRWIFEHLEKQLPTQTASKAGFRWFSASLAAIASNLLIVPSNKPEHRMVTP